MPKRSERPGKSNKAIMQDTALTLSRTYPTAYFRESRKGVPHVVVDAEYQTFSVCWFSKSQIFRVFFPYPSWDQKMTRADFKTLEGVESYLDEQTKLAYNNSKLNKVSGVHEANTLAINGYQIQSRR